MPLVRALTFLSGGIKPNQVLFLPTRAAEILASGGHVATISTPPLEVLPDWKWKASRLKRLDIITVEDLLIADAEIVAGHMKCKTATVEKWRTELMDLIQGV